MPLAVWAIEKDQPNSYWRRFGTATRNDDGSITFTLNMCPLLRFRISESKPTTQPPQ
jgi:hypothetical protein